MSRKKELTVNASVMKSSNIDLTSLQKVGIEDKLTAKYGVVQHPINYNTILEFAQVSSVHYRCLDLKSSIVAGLGYTFGEDESKIGKVLQFIDNLTEKYTDNSISFEKLNKELMFFYYALNRMAIEVRRAGTDVQVYSKKTNDLYISKGWEKIMQITNDNSCQEFAKYGNPKAGLSEILMFSKNYALSDYYTMPDYYSALQSMTINSLTEQYSIAWLNQSTCFDSILTVVGGALSSEVKKEIRGYIESRRGSEAAGKMLMLEFSNTDASISITSMNQNKRDQFIDIENQKERQIIQAHGVPPQLIGIDQSGAISSGEKATGNLKIFKQLLKPDQVELERFWNKFFLTEFGVNPKLKFNEIDLTDSNEDAGIEKIISETYNTYKGIDNSFDLMNEFRVRMNLPPISIDDWEIQTIKRHRV